MGITEEWSDCHVNSLGCRCASDIAICRDRKGQVWDTQTLVFGFHFHRSSEGINPLVAGIPSFICQIRLAVFLGVYMTETDGKPMVIKSDMAEGRDRKGQQIIYGDHCEKTIFLFCINE